MTPGPSYSTRRLVACARLNVVTAALLDRTGLIWAFKLPMDSRAPLPCPLGVWVIVTERHRPQGHHLAIFGCRGLEAPLCVQGNGKPFTGADGVRMLAPEHPALRFGQSPPCGLALRATTQGIQVHSLRRAGPEGGGVVASGGRGQLLDDSGHLCLGLRDPVKPGQRDGVILVSINRVRMISAQ